MGAKLFTAVLGLVLLFALGPLCSKAGAYEEGVRARAYKPHVALLFSPRPYYANVVVRALFDSCWRY
jgi:hypothetical protein